MPPRSFNLCLLGLGNVNRTLVDLLLRKTAELRDRHAILWRITGVASRRLGWQANPDGFDATSLCESDIPFDFAQGNPVRPKSDTTRNCSSIEAWFETAKPDALFEATSLNVGTGEPAISHIRAALERGAHAITANKGPIVHAYRELRDLAVRQRRHFLFESTVMDGVPIFSLFRDTLPAVDVMGFTGILNSTTNVILSEMEQGLSFDDSLKKAQSLGVAETDPSYDLDGWDAAVKVAALVNVVMDIPLPPQKVERQGIRHLTSEAVRAARSEGLPYKLVCRAQRNASQVQARVRPERVPLTDPMALVSGSSSIIRFETDIFPGLTITEENPGLYATAYGMLADFIRAANTAKF